MARFFHLTQIDIDDVAVRLLAEECQRTGMTRPFVVTDVGVCAAGVLWMALDALRGLPYAVFDGTPSSPPKPPCVRRCRSVGVKAAMTWWPWAAAASTSPRAWPSLPSTMAR